MESARLAIQKVSGHGVFGSFSPSVSLWGLIARWEAQRGNRSAAGTGPLEEGQRLHAGNARQNTSPGSVPDTWVEGFKTVGRNLRLSFGDDDAVFTLASEALARLNQLKGKVTNNAAEAALSLAEASFSLGQRQEALEEIARTAENLHRYPAEETAGRSLMELAAVKSKAGRN